MSNGSPAEVEASNDHEAKDVGADGLEARQFSSSSSSKSGMVPTHKWASDAVEVQNLNRHEDGRDPVQVDGDKGPEPALVKQIAD